MKSKSQQSSRSTSIGVASKAARLMHDEDPNVRDVAASALAQTESAQPVAVKASPKRTAETVETVPFDVDDFRSTVLAQCLHGAGSIGFNVGSVENALIAMRIVAELGDHYSVRAFGSRVEVSHG